MDKEHLNENPTDNVTTPPVVAEDEKIEYTSVSDSGTPLIPEDEATLQTDARDISSEPHDVGYTEPALSSEKESAGAHQANEHAETVFVADSNTDARDSEIKSDTPEASSNSEADDFSVECENDDIPREGLDDANDEKEGDNADTEKGTENDVKKPTAATPRTPFLNFVFDMVELLIFSLVAVLFVTAFGFRHSVVDGSSMEQTLFEGEHLIISNLFYTPERGDIVVCEDYSTVLKKPIVKRIIATEGDHIVVNILGEVFVNGELLEEDYVFVDGVDFNPKNIDMIVPEGEIFVMGDHRNLSSDSRDIGTVSVDSILGKVVFRFYPFDKFGTVN